MRAFGLLIGLVGLAWAAGLQAPAEVEAEDGGFLSLPVALVEAADELEVRAPEGFRLLSRPRPEPGRQLLNFYLERGLPAGRYPVTLRLWRAGAVVAEARTAVTVRARADFAVRGPPGGRVVLGEAAEFTVTVRNTGNVPDVYRFELSGREAGVRLEPRRLRLAPGEQGAVRVRLRPLRAEPHVVLVTVRSERAPDHVRKLGWSVTVLPFEGAERLGRRALRYRVELEAGRGPAGWRASARAGIGGVWSDYVQGRSEASLGLGGAALRVAAKGDWGRLGVAAGPAGVDVAFDRGPWSLGAGYGAGGWNARAGWRPEPWRFSVYASAGRQRLEAAWRKPLGSGWWLEPGLFADRWAAPEGLGWGARLTLGYSGPDWLASARGRYQDGRFGLSLQLATRRSRPLGVRGHGFFDGGELGGRLTVRRDLEGPWSAAADLGYAKGRLAWSAELGFAPPDRPWYGGAGLWGRDLDPGLRLRAGYRVEGARLGGWIGWRADGWAYGLDAQLRDEGLTLGASFEREDRPRLGLRLTQSWEGWRVSAGYRYDLASRQGEGSAQVEYAERRWGFELGVRGDAEATETWALLRLRLEGGFPTPEPVIALFGGRRTGVLEGLVYRDANRNGRRDPGEAPVAGARVVCGGARARSGADGKFRLEAEPGRCRLRAEADGGRLGLFTPPEVVFSEGATVRLDLGLVPLAQLSGEAWADANRNGVRDEGERALAGVTVRLAGDGDFERRVRTDAHGRFLAGGLPPGRYRIAVENAGLPHLYRPGPPLEVTLEPGPLAFVAVPAVPVERTVVQTFHVGDAALFVDLPRSSAPPGAELPLNVTVQGGRPEAVVLEVGGRTVGLEPHGEGRWGGVLAVPETARGYLPFVVRARFAEGELRQEGFVTVRPGALASLSARPALVDPGAWLRVEARFLKTVEEAEVWIAGRRYALERRDRWTWGGEIAAPDEPGRYELELRSGGRVWARTLIRVAER